MDDSRFCEGDRVRLANPEAHDDLKEIHGIDPRREFIVVSVRDQGAVFLGGVPSRRPFCDSDLVPVETAIKV